MSSGNVRMILILMLITIGALLVTQVYWFKKSFSLEERQFEEKMNIALRNVADRLLILDNDTTSRIPPISKISSNEFYVKTNCYYSLATLDSILRNEFHSRNIDIGFDYLILKADSNEVLLGNTVFGPVLPFLSDTSEIACMPRTDNKENVDFKIRLNNKTVYLANLMGIWMYSSLSLLVTLAVFTFIMVTIIRGKKLALLKKDFVNNMTHELKTPIANIAVASDAIRNKNIPMDGVKLNKYADIIHNENDRLHHLVDRVLQISDMEKNDETLTYEEIDLHAVIEKVILSFEPLIQQRNGSISTKLIAGHFKFHADKIHLSNVIYNLIENAIKYSNQNPEITIRTRNEKDGVNIEISDKGIGMNKENQERIFEKFFRAETGNVHNTKGFGLGLSYVKLAVEKHRGLITFKSREDVGSTFNIFLPV